MKETTKDMDCGTNQPSLLQSLRAKKFGSDSDAWKDAPFSFPDPEAAKQKMALLIDHRKEFPFKLREAIGNAAENDLDNAINFLSSVYKAFREFFLGRSIERIGDGLESQLCGGSWVGLDDEIDSENEAEVAICFFPSLLKQCYPIWRGKRWLDLEHPIKMLCTEPKSVAFVPLFLKIGHELQITGDDAVFYVAMQLVVHTSDLYYQIFGVRNGREAIYGGANGPDKEIVRKSLLTLMRLEKSAFWQQISFSSYGYNVMLKFINTTPDLSADIVQKILRLWIDSSHWKWFYDCDHFHERFKTTALRVDVEGRIKYYPNQLGFIFHSDSPFARAKPGEGEVIERVLLEHIPVLSRRLGQSRTKTLQNLLINAATDKHIMLDGVYVLLRSDPAMLLLLDKQPAAAPLVLRKKLRESANR